MIPYLLAVAGGYLIGSSSKMFGFGGMVKYYKPEESYKLSPSSSIEREILAKVNTDKNDFVGNFGWKTPQGKTADGYLYKLDSYDQNLVRQIRVKQGEKIFRYLNRTTAITGSKPLIKINLNKGLLYFLQENENDEIIFETRGVKALWINIIEGRFEEYAFGGPVQYKDLSKEQPNVVNDTKTPKPKDVPQIDIVLKEKIKIPNAKQITNSGDAAEIFHSLWDKEQINIAEHMNVLLLNKANVPIGYFEHSKGGIDGTVADVEIISAIALKSLAKGVIIAHNHPSDNLKPSEADIRLSRELKSALGLLKITLLDSLIITSENRRYYSLTDEGLLS